jgi:hypothetical protein
MAQQMQDSSVMALYLVRPDGYIALASFEQSVSRLKTFVEQFNLRFQIYPHPCGADQ